MESNNPEEEQEAKRREILNDLILNSDAEGGYEIIYRSGSGSFNAQLSNGIPPLGTPPMTEEKAKEMIEKWGDDLKLLLYL